MRTSCAACVRAHISHPLGDRAPCLRKGRDRTTPTAGETARPPPGGRHRESPAAAPHRTSRAIGPSHHRPNRGGGRARAPLRGRHCNTFTAWATSSLPLSKERHSILPTEGATEHHHHGVVTGNHLCHVDDTTLPPPQGRHRTIRAAGRHHTIVTDGAIMQLPCPRGDTAPKNFEGATPHRHRHEGATAPPPPRGRHRENPAAGATPHQPRYSGVASEPHQRGRQGASYASRAALQHFHSVGDMEPPPVKWATQHLPHRGGDTAPP